MKTDKPFNQQSTTHLYSVGYTPVGEPTRVSDWGIPTSQMVIPHEFKPSSPRENKCGLCYLVNHCRVTHACCSPSNREDNKDIYYIKQIL